MPPAPAPDDLLVHLDHAEELLHRLHILATNAARPDCPPERRAHLQSLSDPLLAELSEISFDVPTSE